jgi:hypothetical protein
MYFKEWKTVPSSLQFYFKALIEKSMSLVCQLWGRMLGRRLEKLQHIVVKEHFTERNNHRTTSTKITDQESPRQPAVGV